MKLQLIIFFSFTILYFSCTSNENKALKSNTDTIVTVIDTVSQIISNQVITPPPQDELSDSVFFAQLDGSIYEFLTKNDSSLFNKKGFITTVKIGNWFNPAKKYAIIEVTHSMLCLQVWKYENNKWKKLSLCQQNIEDSYCENNTICDIDIHSFYLKDVNGDKYNDLLLQGYGSAGTGVKYFNFIYLYDSQYNKFSQITDENKNYRFMNPYYDSATKQLTTYYIANGGGQCSKYRWKGSKLQHIEEIEIEYLPNDTIHFRKIATIYKVNQQKRVFMKQDTLNSFEDLHKRGYYEYVEVNDK